MKFLRRILPTILFVMVLCLVCAGISLASGGEAGGPKGWVATDTYRVINFAILFIGLFLILRKPLSSGLRQRTEDIKKELETLEAQKKDAEAKLAEYAQKLAKLETEASKIVDEYIRQGNAAKERILEEAESMARKLEEQAKRNIDNEFAQAKVMLQKEIVEKALEKAEEQIRSAIQPEDQNRLVDEYLEKVVA